jgi:hypothetical protein
LLRRRRPIVLRPSKREVLVVGDLVVRRWGSRCGAHAIPIVGNCFIESSANQVDGNSLSVVLSKRFSLLRASGK